MPKRNRRKTITFLQWGITALILGFALFLFLTKTGAVGNSTPTEITALQAQIELQHGALLLDVREQDEYDRTHVSGSALIPLGALSSRAQDLPRDRLIIVMCQSGVRSAQGREILRSLGYSRVTSLSGGIQAWINSGLPVETDGSK